MKVVGQLVVGPHEKYLTKTLDDFQRLCDDVVVATCNTDPQTLQLLDQYDFRHYEDNREWGKHQPSIKTDLLRRIVQLRPDRILVLDADETVPTLTRESLRDVLRERSAVYLYVVNLWNDEHHYAKALSFWNVRAYDPNASPDRQFLRKPVHCGNAPPYFYAQSAKASYVPHLLIHRGLLLPEDRLRKAQRYELYDPRAIHKGRDYYDALTAEGTGSEFNQEQVTAKIHEYIQRLK